MLLNKQQGNPNPSPAAEPLTGAGDATMRNSETPAAKPRSLRTAKIVGAILFLAVVAAIALRNFPPALPGKPAAPKGKPPAPVRVTKVVSGDAPLQIEAIGNVEPIQTVSIRSQVAGQIQKVFFTEGQDVRKGDMLFEIDPRPFQAAVMQAEANRSKDMAQVKQAQANMAKDQFQVRQAEANLARDTAQERNAYKQFTRYKLLVGEGAVSQEQS
ncbi:MAG: efflux RND transporter periplasmic adaptor subunit, partial [Terriglobales bacterium]